MTILLADTRIEQTVHALSMTARGRLGEPIEKPLEPRHVPTRLVEMLPEGRPTSGTTPPGSSTKRNAN